MEPLTMPLEELSRQPQWKIVYPPLKRVLSEFITGGCRPESLSDILARHKLNVTVEDVLTDEGVKIVLAMHRGEVSGQ
jgi:hypothetical protein